jgi:agmatine/peptidylarginine deiminase
MSGGSYDYFSFKFDEFIRDLKDDTEERKKFKKLLKLVSYAVYTIEWVDSGDLSQGDENKHIDKVFNFLEKSE